MSARFKTKYPGVFYREAERIAGKGMEKVYYVVYKKNGKLHEEKAGRQFADDMTPARASSYRSELIEGKRLPRKEIRRVEEKQKRERDEKYTIDKLWEAYKANRKIGKSINTDKGRYNKYIKPIFGHKEPKEIVRLEVDRLRINLLKKRSPQTVKHVLNLLTWIINYGVNNNLCLGVAFQIQKPSVNNQSTEDLTPNQLNHLFTAINKAENKQAANLMKLALYTGMRRGELFRLKWEDIDGERGFINIKGPKGGVDQQIPLNDAASRVLESHVRTDSPFVFPGRGGGQRTDIKKQVNKIKEDAGLPKEFRALHGLRHVYASTLASSGEVDMYTLQKLLTHKSPLMTQRYAHLRDETLKRASNLAGELISGSEKGFVAGKKVINIEDEKE